MVENRVFLWYNHSYDKRKGGVHLMNNQDSHTALLSSKDAYTIFQFGSLRLRFKAPYSLERYTEIIKWDRGYLVVMAKYAHDDDAEEEYIDLVPILEKLYFNAEEVLRPIQNVRIAYA